jgi:ATP-dependent helicase/nuclease subunit B
MNSFLDKIAAYLINNFAEETDRICIVLPNRRAGLFLKKYIANHTRKIIWAPQIYSLEDFIISLSGFKIIDPVYLQFEFYNVYKNIEGSNAQSFEEFIKWGKVLLNDFNEIDRYLVEPAELFSYLTDEKAISLWNPENVALTDFQIKYLRFYQSLNKYYTDLSTSLSQKDEAYKGMAYRKVAQQIASAQEQLPWQKILFAGFNALTQAEKEIIFTLEKSGKAEVLWDADSYYINDTTQEAGKFIREIYHHQDKKAFKWIENNFEESVKEISLLGVPQNVGQVKVAGDLLLELARMTNELDQTAVILNDESMVEPLLNSIPKEAGKFNVTMGLPLQRTPLFRLIDAVLELQTNIIKFDRSENKKPKIYYRDLLRFIEHPYMEELLAEADLSDVPVNIRKSNRIFIDPNELVELYFKKESTIKKLIIIIVEPWQDNPKLTIERLLIFINELKIHQISGTIQQADVSGKIDFKLEYLFYFHQALHKLNELMTVYPFIENLRVFRSFYTQVMQITLPFYGEPLHGLQVMGMLETQTLDFKNIIMLGVNEDFIPAGKSTHSFIPFDIRRKFLLPTYQDRNSIFAYHFYRILQRAEKISLIYNTEPGELGGGDKSRFISQLEYELRSFNPAIKINNKILSVPAETEKNDDKIEIKKSTDILQKLSNHADYGFSASALNTYRNCPLQYYFKYVAGIDELEEPEETIEASTLGSVIHEVLAELYKPFSGRKILPEDIQKMQSQSERLVKESFQKNYAEGDIDYGKNHLILKVASQYIHKFLEHEIAFIKKTDADGGFLIIREIEEPFYAIISIEAKGINPNVKLTGRFDRVDEHSGTTRIIDYKTGKVERWELKLKSWEELLTDSKLDKCFQLLFYAFLYSYQKPVNLSSVVPGIITFRSMSSGLLTITLPEDELPGEQSNRNFEKILKSILGDIFNPELPFQQTELIESCQYCSFASICNRN